jgi:nickel-dependent lactate racemase
VPFETVSLPYGRGVLELRLPASLIPCLRRAEAASVEALPEPLPALEEALLNPIGSAPLPEALRGRKRIVVVVSDPTRSVAYPTWLPWLLDFIRRHADSGSTVTLLMGGGTHEPPSPEEARAFLGVSEDVIFHDSRDESLLVSLGDSTRGTPITANRLGAEADLIIATGAVGYHYFAGFTGGVKAVFPGLGGFDAVVANHGLCLDLEAHHFAAGVAPGALDGNPVYEDLLEVVPRLPPVFLVNTVLAEDKHPALFVAGDTVAAHRRACDFVDSHFRVGIGAPADLILLSAGGHPRDLSLYQAHKALKHAEGALAPRSRVLFFAQCPEGMGHPSFAEWQPLDYAATMQQLRAGYRPIGHLALSLRILAKLYDITLVTELDDETVEAWGFSWVSPKQAADKAAWMMVSAEAPLLVAHGASLLLTGGQAAP